MNFQEKIFQAAAELHARSLALAHEARKDAAKRATAIQASLATLRGGGRSLDQVVRRHAARFVKENVTIARAAGKDVSALARDTYQRFARSGDKKPVAPTRKSVSSRKRTRAKSSN